MQLVELLEQIHQGLVVSVVVEKIQRMVIMELLGQLTLVLVVVEEDMMAVLVVIAEVLEYVLLGINTKRRSEYGTLGKS